VITPALEGDWELEYSRSLAFKTQAMPKRSTEYTVTVPKNVVSYWEASLEHDYVWKFQTELIHVVNFQPTHGKQFVEPTLFISFSQDIDPQAVSKCIVLEYEENKKMRQMKVKPTNSNVVYDKDVMLAIQNAPNNRWVTVTSESRLLYNKSIAVKIGPYIPSAEGPLLSDSSCSYNFHTCNEFQVEGNVEAA
jgi:hypothetical protein